MVDHLFFRKKEKKLGGGDFPSFIVKRRARFQVILDINVQIAIFRDLLIHVGTSKDAPELREKIRRVRRQCVEGCKQTNAQILPQIKR